MRKGSREGKGRQRFPMSSEQQVLVTLPFSSRASDMPYCCKF